MFIELFHGRDEKITLSPTDNGNWQDVIPITSTEVEGQRRAGIVSPTSKRFDRLCEFR